MKRKLVKQGTSTLMLSLPSKWIKENRLDKGEEINLSQEGNKLVIETESRKKESSVVKINVSNCSPLVNRLLMSQYIKGVDEVEVSFSDIKEVKDFQKRVLNELIGFEIIKQGKTSFTVKDITGIENQEIDQIIQRIFLILDSMQEELFNAIKKDSDFETVIESDFSTNKFINFALRILNKKGYIEYKKTPQIYSLLLSLEYIGDLYKKVAVELTRNKKVKISKQQISNLEDTRDFLKMFENLFFKFNKSELVLFAKKYESIKKKLESKSYLDFLILELVEAIIKMNNSLMVLKDVE